MNYFDVVDVVWLLNELMQAECLTTAQKMQGFGGVEAPAHVVDRCLATIEKFRVRSEVGGMDFLRHPCAIAKDQLSRPLVDVSTVQTVLNAFKGSLLHALQKQKFLKVEEDRCEYLDRDGEFSAALFGPTVAQAFPSTTKDLREAGNCLAAECCTASVFHLMRAAEFVLRALAEDRNITAIKNKPLADAQWGDILNHLGVKLTGLRDAPRSSWASTSARDAQIRFYNEVVQELRSFNDAWRRHVSHADADAFYNCNEALGIMEHVRSFMQKLATNISETATTPEYWLIP